MLAEFQQAFADLVASPALCREVRDHPGLLRDRYELTEQEHARLVGIVVQRGMECTCMLYRANRLAPLVMNLPRVCRALGHDLKLILDDYWAEYPNSSVHFLFESHRFCNFLEQQLAKGRRLPSDLASALVADVSVVSHRLSASYTQIGPEVGQPPTGQGVVKQMWQYPPEPSWRAT